ncbi:hypothetical protein K7432_012466 [Basidiobolus ranarum]|uniref:Uncharacterized protein n=1 Tax=Basidiobolus ranarum TaxID=34480 RepID=A0ABR2WKS1_9FUNG
MNTSSISVCQFPQLLSSERPIARKNEVFQVSKPNLVSLGQLYGHPTLQGLLGLEKALLHASWIVLVHLYSKNTDITFGTSNLKQSSHWMFQDLEVFQTTYDENSEKLLAADWIKQLSNVQALNPLEVDISLNGTNTDLFNTFVVLSDKETMIDVDGLEVRQDLPSK